jgi:trans-2,3-dihydro-3-hydroxyanthranilate isomerase
VVEIPFAGHPVLGSAFVLAGPLQMETIRLETAVGVVPVRVEREGARIVFGRMEQPVPTWSPHPQADEMLAALGVDASQLPVEVYDNGLQMAYVVLSSEEAVAAVEPDLIRLAKLAGVVGTNTCAGSGDRWKTRMFAPADGVPEDPATGSAAGPLAVHLLRHGLIESGQEIEISQGAEVGRPSTLYAAAWGTSDEIGRVEVAGRAVVVARGEFQL